MRHISVLLSINYSSFELLSCKIPFWQNAVVAILTFLTPSLRTLLGGETAWWEFMPALMSVHHVIRKVSSKPLPCIFGGVSLPLFGVRRDKMSICPLTVESQGENLPQTDNLPLWSIVFFPLPRRELCSQGAKKIFKWSFMRDPLLRIRLIWYGMAVCKDTHYQLASAIMRLNVSR